MSNAFNYLMILESLNLFPEEKDETSRISKNLQILQESLGCDIHYPSNTSDLHKILQESITESSDLEWKYAASLYHIITSVVDLVNFDSTAKEDLLSVKHTNLFIYAIQDAAVYGVRPNLHTVFKSHDIFSPVPQNCTASVDNLKICLQVLRRVVTIKSLQTRGLLNEVIRDYIAGILTIIESDLNKQTELSDDQRKGYQNDLNSVWDSTSKSVYFRTILLCKALPQLPPALQKRLHMELLNKLMTKGGFTSLVRTLFTKRLSTCVAESEYSEVVANIIGRKGHSPQFYRCLIDQIFEFLKQCTVNTNMAPWMGAGLLTLKKLYEINKETKNYITEKIYMVFQKLVCPDDLLSGLIVMEYNEFANFCSSLFNSFCNSSIECLPSELLTKYLPLLFSVYSYIPDKFREKAKIRGIIVRCLANRGRSELESIIKSLVSKKYPSDWVNLNPRVSIRPKADSEVSIKIVPLETAPEDLNISSLLPEVLMNSNNNILTYVVFMCLLHMMQEALLDEEDSEEVRIDLLQTEDDLNTFLNAKYSVKVEIILCLSSLVTHPSLRAQISDDESEFLSFMRTLIQRRSNQSASNQENTDRTLLLMLTITQEMIENSTCPGKYQDFSKPLQELKKQTANELVVAKINNLLELLDGGFKGSVKDNSGQYKMARDLMQAKEPHLKVYGMNMLIEMLKNGDEVVKTEGHVILALALEALKDIESYTFLNCVRLVVALVNVMRSEVLETLSHEYLNKDNTMDYRLVVGEAILKTTKELGPFSYKYKDVLLNCFMSGCRSEMDEFRWSSFSNLATLCRILTFQVHNFFQELLLLIRNEVQTGKYIPAKRAAVFVLSELLLGVDNLLNHQDYLLPIYRALKTLESDSDDEKIRLHAANGLRALDEKCREFLFPEEKLEKEIKIFGIKDNDNKKPGGHILELN